MTLQKKKAIILVESLYNDLELWYPYYRLKEEGADVSIVGPEAGKKYTGKSGIIARADKGMNPELILSTQRSFLTAIL
jgi:protease I